MSSTSSIENATLPLDWLEGTLIKFRKQRMKKILLAVEVGDIKAQYNFAYCYQNGEGTTKNEEKAIELYSKAAKAGHSDAQLNLAHCYLNGGATTKNSEKVFELYSKAALGNCYEYGEGTTENLEKKKAYELYSNVAQAGHSGAQNALGSCYQNGRGTTKNDEKAFEFYSKAVEAGGLLGELSLREYYPNGLETVNDLEKDQNDLERFILGLQNRGLKYPCTSKREFFDFEDFFDQLSDEFRWEREDSVLLEKFIAHLNCASCKYILQCYGITKDITNKEFVMVLPFAEYENLRAFLKVNETTLTWDILLHILFQIAGGLRFIHDPKLVHGDLHPGNILVLKMNPLKVVISDLGFCRPADNAP
ncbi:hypothetical protein G9A89_002579 [Geosiphon pyriformis]|nr:hypothetical protein G9A89_002579 [Geosiphon pyriformis]